MTSVEDFNSNPQENEEKTEQKCEDGVISTDVEELEEILNNEEKLNDKNMPENCNEIENKVVEECNDIISENDLNKLDIIENENSKIDLPIEKENMSKIEMNFPLNNDSLNNKLTLSSSNDEDVSEFVGEMQDDFEAACAELADSACIDLASHLLKSQSFDEFNLSQDLLKLHLSSLNDVYPKNNDSDEIEPESDLDKENIKNDNEQSDDLPNLNERIVDLDDSSFKNHDDSQTNLKTEELENNYIKLEVKENEDCEKPNIDEIVLPETMNDSEEMNQDNPEIKNIELESKCVGEYLEELELKENLDSRDINHDLDKGETVVEESIEACTPMPNKFKDFDVKETSFSEHGLSPDSDSNMMTASEGFTTPSASPSSVKSSKSPVPSVVCNLNSKFDLDDASAIPDSSGQDGNTNDKLENNHLGIDEVAPSDQISESDSRTNDCSCKK